MANATLRRFTTKKILKVRDEIGIDLKAVFIFGLCLLV